MKNLIFSIGWLCAVAAAILASLSLGTGRFVLFALPLLPLGLACSIKAPHYLLFLVAGIWSIMWLPGLPVGSFLAAKEIMAFAYLGSMILHSGLNKHAMFTLMFKVPTTWMLLTYVAACLPGVLLSSAPMTSLSSWARLLATVFIYSTLLYHFKLKPNIAPLVLLLVLSSLLPSMFLVFVNSAGLVPPFTPPSAFNVRNPAALGLSHKELALSWAAAYVLPVAIAFWLDTWRKSKAITWAWVALSASLFLTCLLTHGRGGLFAGSLGAVATMVLMRRNAKGIIAFSLAVLSFVIVLNREQLISILLRTTQTGYSADQIINNQTSSSFLEIVTSGRSTLYEMGIQAFLKSPVTGVGLRQFGEHVLMTSGLEDAGAHNMYLSTAVESGILAFLSVCVMMVYIMSRYYRVAASLAEEAEGFLLAAAYGIIVASFLNTVVEVGVMFNSLYSGIPFWVAVALIDSSNMKADKLEETEMREMPRNTKSVLGAYRGVVSAETGIARSRPHWQPPA